LVCNPIEGIADRQLVDFKGVIIGEAQLRVGVMRMFGIIRRLERFVKAEESTAMLRRSFLFAADVA
jgi:hypothetical protein